MTFCPRKLLLMLIMAPHAIFIIMTHFRTTGKCLESPFGNKRHKYSSCIMYGSYTLNGTWSQNTTEANRKFKSDSRPQSAADCKKLRPRWTFHSLKEAAVFPWITCIFTSDYFIYRMWLNKSHPLSLCRRVNRNHKGCLQTHSLLCINARSVTPSVVPPVLFS